jgi:hypothetical protein
MKPLAILLILLLFSGCATRPSNNPIKETGRRMGASVYKTTEAEIYKKVDKQVTDGVRKVF